MEALWSELRHAARRLARRPAFSGVALATLALGIGGATAIFSVADAVVLRPLPYPQGERLLTAWQRDLKRSQPFLAISYPFYSHWRDHNGVFEELAGMGEMNDRLTLSRRGKPFHVAGRLVSASFFAALRVPPLHGRWLSPEDDRVGGAPAVVVSHSLWQRLGSDPALVGQSLVLDQQAYTVVGVMPRGFAYPPGAEVWRPLVAALGAEGVENGAVQWMIALGRLQDGVTVEQARTEMSGLIGAFLRGVVERHNLQGVVDPDGYAAVLTPLRDSVLGPTRPLLLALLGAVTLVLLMACANVAGLLLVRTADRSEELAVRLSLGASPGRLARGLLVESALLAMLGGAAGLLAARAAIPLLVRLSPEDVPRLQEASLDWRVFSFSLAASLAAALLCGLAPMLLVRRASWQQALRAGSRSVAAGHHRVRAALVVSQVAIALVLLAGAGLLARTFAALQRVPLGFQPEHVLSLEASAPSASYPDAPRWRLFYQELLRRVQAVPGVEAAATVSVRPLAGPTGWDFPFTLEGQSEAEARQNPLVNLEEVSTDYFRTMGIAVKRGRAFTAMDVEGQPGVVVVSESMARHCWPGQDAIGKRMKVPQWKTSYHEAWLSVVGVVDDARYRELRATRFDLYMSYLQGDHPTGSLVVRTRQEPAALAGPVREAVWSMDRDQAPPAVVTMTSAVSQALAAPRFAMRVFGAFAIVAATLAALGLYGLLAYSVAWRTREIGLRLALGALRRHVALLVLRQALALTAVGMAIGCLAAVAATRLLERLLYGVSPTDAVTLAAVAGLLLAVALLACGLPLRRALGVDPAVALRHE